MPLTTGKGSITSQTGNISQVLISEIENYSDESTIDATAARVVASGGGLSGGDLYKFQPRINSMDIAREGVTLPAVFFDGSAAQTQDAPGPLDIANGLSFGLSGNGTALFFRMLTQSKNPDWNIFGASGQTIPSAVNVVANTARLMSAETAATVADNLSSTVNPVQLTVTPTSTSRPSGSRGIVTITGTDNDDSVISESVTFTADNVGTAATTKLWYKTVTGVTSSQWTEAGTSTYGITARDRSAQVIFEPQDDELVAFWTAEVAKGTVPNLYRGLCMQNATVEITRDALVAFDCTFLGRKADLYTNFAGDTGSTAQKTDISGTGITYASADVFGGWQATLTGENTDIEIALQEATFTLNQELEYTNVLGEQFQPTQPARGDKRLVQIEATVVYSPENDYSTYFEGNQTMPNVQLNFTQKGLGAYPYQLTFEMPEMQLTADPDPAVADTGTITQTVTMKAVKSARLDYEYRVRARYSEYDQVRIYS